MVTQEQLIAQMMVESSEFAKTGEFKRAVAESAAATLNLTPSEFIKLYRPLIENCEKISARVYRWTGHKMLDSSISVPVAKPIVKLVARVEPAVFKNYVPSKDELFIKNSVFKNVSNILDSGLWCPTYLTGPSGTGKSTAIMQAHAVKKRGIIRVNCTKTTDDDVLIGSKTIRNGDIEIVEGPVVIAMRQGISILLDEIDLCNPNSIMTLQGVLEGKSFYFALKDEYITPAKGFNVFATGNTRGKGSSDGRYIGTQVLNEAFLDRFTLTFDVAHPTEKEEFNIVSAALDKSGNPDDVFAKELTKWSAAIRQVFEQGACDEEISTRRLLHIVTAYSIFKNKRKAVEMCINRFDTVTRDSFYKLFDKICSEVQEEQKTESVIDSMNVEETPA